MSWSYPQFLVPGINVKGSLDQSGGIKRVLEKKSGMIKNPEGVGPNVS